MIKFFRKIRQKLIDEKRFGKYLIYAIGEILLVVIGIIIAVSLGEWRQQVNDKNEVLTYYNNLIVDLQQDKTQLNELIQVYEKSSAALVTEINKLQLDGYNQDSLYKGFSNWNVYTSASKFKPQIAIYSEIVSNGKLKLINEKSLKAHLLKLYTDTYPDLEFYQKNSIESIRSTITSDMSSIFRWLLAFNNDNLEETTIKLKNPMVQFNDDWLKNKQSEGFRIFENQLSLRYGTYSGTILRYKDAINEIELLESEISKVLDKNKE
tara:strand:+ start:2114 stop:2908 length:795 start_codon:yes stop_codon:yes gene_type:complete